MTLRREPITYKAPPRIHAVIKWPDKVWEIEGNMDTIEVNMERENGPSRIGLTLIGGITCKSTASRKNSRCSRKATGKR